MKKIVVIAGIVLVGVLIFFVSWQLPQKDAPSVVLGVDYKNATYQIDGQRVMLKDGVAHIVAGDDTATKSTVRYFGNNASGDFNSDGLADTAFILTQDNGGSGTFYYAVVALKTADGYIGTNGILLGDRIAPQTTEFKDGKIIANYSDRYSGEPFTTKPSLGVSRYLKISEGKLIEVPR